MITLQDCFRKLLPCGLKFQPPWAALEYALRFSRQSDAQRERRLRAFMASADMAEFVQRYAGMLAASRTFSDLLFEGELLVSGHELAALYALREHTPLRIRLQRAHRLAVERLAPLYRPRLGALVQQLKSRGEDEKDALRMARRACQAIFAPVAAQMRAMFRMRAGEAYRGMWGEGAWIWATGEPPSAIWDDVCAFALNELDEGYLSCESAALYAYLRTLLYGPLRSGIRHVLIDEAQDYSAVEMRLIEAMYPGSGMTVLQDVNQRIGLI
jgi:DNA helicase-2/ATP-dependent DNA helicase PcrA